MIPSLNDYLGTYQGGILASIGIMHEGVYYDSIFYYTKDKMIITPQNELIIKLGCDIESVPYYVDFMKSVITLVDPYEEIFDKLEEIKSEDGDE